MFYEILVACDESLWVEGERLPGPPRWVRP